MSSTPHETLCNRSTLVPRPHVLLVEDQDRVARGLEELLQLEGFRVSLATDGPSGLQVASAAPPDAIVLDVMLPGMTGFDVCRTLRSRVTTRDVPIVLLTGMGDTPSKLQGFQIGADDYLVKPVPARELAARLRKLIGSRVETAQQIHRQRLQAIGEIAAAVGHEIKNPLAAVLGTLDLVLLRGQLPEETQQDLAMVRCQLWRVASVLRQLTAVHDRTVPYVGPDRMIDLSPEGTA
jgi:CheY-like chemotaxis protein